MISNKYPFTDSSNFSDDNKLLGIDELDDVEKNLESNVLDKEKIKIDNPEKIFWLKIIINIRNNCCICLISLFIVSILIFILKI